MNTDPSGKPYRKNEEQSEAAKADLMKRLKWEKRDDTSLRGFLPAHPGNTLFIIEDCAEKEVQLMGAFIPDDEEQEVWDLKNAKAAAESYLLEWLEKVGAPILANQ